MRTFFASLAFVALSALTVTFASPRSSPVPLPTDKGGIVLTFDDRNFSEWLAALPLFDDYGVKATFFISGPIDQTALDAALELKKTRPCDWLSQHPPSQRC